MPTDNPKSLPTKKQTRRPKFAPLGILFGVVGLVLFAYFVRKAGITSIIDGIQRLGTGFLLILAISSLRYMVRSLAWTKCVEPPFRLRFRDAFSARLMGDALGNIIPLASVAISEPSKAVFVKDKVPLMVGLSALAIENICYSLSVAVFIFSGTATLLLSFQLPKALRYASIGSLVATLMVVPLIFLIIRQRSKFLSGAIRFLEARRIAPKLMANLLPRAQTLEERVYGFYQRNQTRFISIFGLELGFHLAGVAEVYTTLSFISPVAPSLRQAFILESVNRIINVAFKFVPMRVGVDEGGTGQVSRVLGFVRGTGETLAIIRKGRDLFWSSIGIVLLWKKGFSLRANVADMRDALPEQKAPVQTVAAGE
jgi:hypothetical protein